MSIFKIIFTFSFAFICSYLLTGLAKMYAVHKSIIDIPNQRSSHLIPTPRGGGIAIVFTFSFFITLLTGIGIIEPAFCYALLGGLLVAAVGYFDDIFSIPAKWRLLLHFLSAGWAIYWLGSFLLFSFSWLNVCLSTFAIVWCINFYNFMDGIDGIAGVEGIFVSVTCAFILLGLGQPHLALIAGVLSTSIAGFIFWNWPPAKIFMGDVGSGYLGYILAIFGLYTANKIILPISFWCIILAVFLCDATLTLFYRIYKGEVWYQAHKDHAYQNLIIVGLNHRQITLGVLILNICFLLPLSIGIIYQPNKSYLFVGTAILVLTSLWYGIKFKFLINK